MVEYLGNEGFSHSFASRQITSHAAGRGRGVASAEASVPCFCVLSEFTRGTTAWVDPMKDRRFVLRSEHSSLEHSSLCKVCRMFLVEHDCVADFCASLRAREVTFCSFRGDIMGINSRSCCNPWLFRARMRSHSLKSFLGTVAF